MIKKKKVNESPVPDLGVVAAGIAAVIGSGVGLAGLMDYLKKKYPDAYETLSELGTAASKSRSKDVNVAESAAVDLATVAAGIAGVIGSGIGIAGLMDYLKEEYPDAYETLSKLGTAASKSRSKGVNVAESAKPKLRLETISESLASSQPTKVGEGRVASTWERVAEYREALGDEEFIQNVLVKLSNDDTVAILDAIAQDYQLDVEEEEEELEETE